MFLHVLRGSFCISLSQNKLQSKNFFSKTRSKMAFISLAMVILLIRIKSVEAQVEIMDKLEVIKV